jgi:hypothetical protein
VSQRQTFDPPSKGDMRHSTSSPSALEYELKYAIAISFRTRVPVPSIETCGAELTKHPGGESIRLTVLMLPGSIGVAPPSAFAAISHWSIVVM